MPKPFHFSTLSVFAVLSGLSWQVASQELAPKVEVPLKESFTLKYTPGFDSICTSTTFSKKKGEWFGKKETATALAKTVLENESPFYLLEVSVGSQYLKMKSLIDTSGALDAGEPIVDTNFPSSPELDLITTALKRSTKYGSLIGKTFSPGNPVKPALCSLIGVQSIGEQNGGYKGEGLVTLNRRTSFLVSVDTVETCYLQGISIQAKSLGWYAVDVDSGHTVSLSLKNQFLNGNELVSEETTDGTCQILKNSSFREAVNHPSGKEAKLQEAKDLFEKGLISKDIYDQTIQKLMGLR